jgi:hypothetical protein
MGALLESGLVGNIGLKHLKVIKEDTINKWDRLGFLEGLKGHLKENVAQLYENQASHLINEATSEGSNGAFETVVFPIVRRVFSKLLANDIVSVQAMNLPIGKLFFFVPKIQGYNGGITADGAVHYPPIGSPEAVNSGDNNPQQGYTTGNPYAKNLYDLFYEGAEPGLDPGGLFDYSKGRWSAATAPATVVVWSNGDLVNAGNDNPQYIGNTRKVLIRLCGWSNVVGAGKLIGPDGNEVDTETFLSDLKIIPNTGLEFSSGNTCPLPTAAQPLLFRVVTQKYGKGIVQYGEQVQTDFYSGPDKGNGGSFYDICNANGCIILEVDLSCPACATCGSDSLDGYTGSTLSGVSSGESFTAVWRTYEELEFEEKIGEVSFDLESVTVSVTERKLRAQWSPELAQDVAAFHNIDAEAELTALLSEQVAAEIDREILRDLRKGAAWNLR